MDINSEDTSTSTLPPEASELRQPNFATGDDALKRTEPQEEIEFPPNKRAKSSIPTTSIPDVGPLRAEGDRKELEAKLVLVKHTEKSYTDEVQDQNAAILCAHQTYARGHVPFKHKRDLGACNFSLIDEVSSDELFPGKARARKLFTFTRYSDPLFKPAELARLNTARNLEHEHVLMTVMTYEENIHAQRMNYGIILSPVADCTLAELLDRISRSGEAFEAQLCLRKRWLGCLASGLSYLHARGFVNTDLGPSNIVVKAEKLYFTEFAISSCFSRSGIVVEEVGPKSKAISYVYRAPEFKTRETSGPKADIFSLGCIFLEILTVMAGKSLENLRPEADGLVFQPYSHRYTKTLQWLTGLLGDLKSTFLQSLLPLCEKMIQQSPRSRPTAFNVTLFIFDSIVKAGQELAKEEECACIYPWVSKNDGCFVVLSGGDLSGLRSSEFYEPGAKYALPRQGLADMDDSNCSYCSERCEDKSKLMVHIFAKHPSTTKRTQPLSCTELHCLGEPEFQNEAEYQKHLADSHGFDIHSPTLGQRGETS